MITVASGTQQTIFVKENHLLAEQQLIVDVPLRVFEIATGKWKMESASAVGTLWGKRRIKAVGKVLIDVTFKMYINQNIVD